MEPYKSHPEYHHLVDREDHLGYAGGAQGLHPTSDPASPEALPTRLWRLQTGNAEGSMIICGMLLPCCSIRLKVILYTMDNVLVCLILGNIGFEFGGFTELVFFDRHRHFQWLFIRLPELHVLQPCVLFIKMAVFIASPTSNNYAFQLPFLSLEPLCALFII